MWETPSGQLALCRSRTNKSDTNSNRNSRSAQALELHRQKDIHQQSSTSLEKTLSQIWYEEYKRRVWMNLYIWDR